MKKKLLSVLLSAAMVLTLAGCGSGTETAATEEATGAAEETTEASGTEADAVEGSKGLKVAMECGYAPYNWTQPDDANGAVPINDSSDYAYGYDVMIAKTHWATNCRS